MKQYVLKEGVQDFTVIDGPMAGKSFKAGVIYDEIPPQEAAKFVIIPEAPAEDAPATKDKKDKK